MVGRMVKLREAEAQITINYDVYDRPLNDPDLLIAASKLMKQGSDGQRAW